MSLSRRLGQLERRLRTPAQTPLDERMATLKRAMTGAERAQWTQLVAKYEQRFGRCPDPAIATEEMLEPEDREAFLRIGARASRRLGWPLRPAYQHYAEEPAKNGGTLRIHIQAG